MIEVVATYDLRYDIDQKVYAAFVKKAIDAELHAPGFVELRAHRNVLGSPQVRVTHVWKSLADWVKFVDSPESRALDTEFRSFVANIEVQIWGPSPVMPEPLRARE